MKSVSLVILAALLMTGTILFFWQERGAQRNRAPATMPDPQEQALFEACVEQRDREIHRRVFDTIDNPDVQREILATEKERAIRECHRRRAPEGTPRDTP